MMKYFTDLSCCHKLKLFVALPVLIQVLSIQHLFYSIQGSKPVVFFYVATHVACYSACDYIQINPEQNLSKNLSLE